ncbi:rhoptry kinase family protein ROP26 (incomplete catalytic triad) [Besnoitia besnoiti]|uniref:Rhoptry kinase family protein ROP26 (Incomplete catalytic triad) n=1 Tax=Besnoitia besnoiti TaxID=94643 RepID=A0A2A9MAA2_BESBE|nr:rhoptry kinase family protein ROP26 (incomplete catalytic triad) [Besnoitia besnoiti]PFH32322.1 rhoptry kinase family protein ROP26 (incomplete catalytic triad) [Besnoitia besnoiti]
MRSRSQAYRELLAQAASSSSHSEAAGPGAGVGERFSMMQKYRVGYPSPSDMACLKEVVVTAAGLSQPASPEVHTPMQIVKLGEDSQMYSEVVHFLGLTALVKGFMLMRIQEQPGTFAAPESVYWQPALHLGEEGDRDRLDAAALRTAVMKKYERESRLLPPEYEKHVRTVFYEFGLQFPLYICKLQRPGEPLVLELQGPGPASVNSLLNIMIAYSAADLPLYRVRLDQLSAGAADYIARQMILEIASFHALGFLHMDISDRSFFFSTSECSGRSETRRLIYLGNLGNAQRQTGVAEPFVQKGAVAYYDPQNASVFKTVPQIRPLVVYDQSRDAWAVGKLLYQVLCKGSGTPFGYVGGAASPLVIANRITAAAQRNAPIVLDNCFDPLSSLFMSELLEIMSGFLRFDSRERLLPLDAIKTYPRLFDA